MSSKKIVLWCALALVVILLVASISIPNLMRTRIFASEASHASTVRTIAMDLIDSGEQQDAQKSEAGGEDHSYQDERKIIQTAMLDLIVVSVQDAASRIEALAQGAGGYVEKSEFLQARPGSSLRELWCAYRGAGREQFVTRSKKLHNGWNLTSRRPAT